MAKGFRDVAKENLGSNIRELRLAVCKSKEDLAKVAQIRRALVGEIERGEANPTLDSIMRIARALDVELSDLFEPKN